MQPAAVDVLDVDRRVGWNSVVQPRLVIEAGQQGQLLRQGHRHPVGLDRVQPGERRERVEKLPARRAVGGGRRRSDGGGHGSTLAHGIAAPRRGEGAVLDNLGIGNLVDGEWVMV